MSFCIVYLASPRDFVAFGISRIQVLQTSVKITRRVFPTTDIYIFHEDYTEEDKQLFPSSVEFIPVDFKGIQHYFQTDGKVRIGYLMMCRFFCGVLQSYPQLQKYTHHMRLDDDSFFLEPYITEDKVKSFLQYDYVYRSLFFEAQDQHSLYEFTVGFLQRNGIKSHRLQTLVQELEHRTFLKRGRYTGYAPYNNFHIASMKLWTHPKVQAYIREIEVTKGIFKHRWLDANIHAMIVFMIAPFAGLTQHIDMTFGYRHNVHVSHMNSPLALADETLSFCPQDVDLQ